MARRRRARRPGALTELPPLKILGQMAILQTLFYGSALVLALFTALVAGTRFSLDLVFGWEAVRGDTTQGWLMGFIWLLSGGFCLAVAIVLIVTRSKLVLDFALSTHFIHLVVATLYTGQIPRHAMWWASMTGACGIALSLGIWGCRYRELQPITFGGNGASSTGESSGPVDTGAGDEEEGYSRGRGRGRGRDGAGNYEMVRVTEDQRTK